MTNLEYLANKGIICKNDFTDGEGKPACNIVIAIRDNDINIFNEYESFKDYLLAEHKGPIELTQAEKCILENINKTFCYIARDCNGTLNVFEYKPSKNNYGEWVLHLGAMCTFCLFDNLFKFIKLEDKEPYLIENILNNCEVIE